MYLFLNRLRELIFDICPWFLSQDYTLLPTNWGANKLNKTNRWSPKIVTSNPAVQWKRLELGYKLVFSTAAESRQCFALFQFQFVIVICRFVCLKKIEEEKKTQKLCRTNKTTEHCTKLHVSWSQMMTDITRSQVKIRLSENVFIF